MPDLRQRCATGKSPVKAAEVLEGDNQNSLSPQTSLLLLASAMTRSPAR